jgi:tetratricopeptide (TPR) repeat protein
VELFLLAAGLDWSYDAAEEIMEFGRCSMTRSLVLFVVLAGLSAGAQVERISIPAGTPEDKDSQAISAENDSAKRLPMLQDFLQKYSANPQAVAYAESQISQLYQEQGDNAKALEHGKKAVAIQPKNIDLLVALAGIAQQMKDAAVVMDCAVRGGTAFHSIATQPKPEGMSSDEWASKLSQQEDTVRSAYQFLEATGLNTMVGEQDPKKRIGYVEGYLIAFPDSRFQDQAMQLAVYTLGQLNDPARLASFTDKALAANPNSVGLLVVLADAFAESPDPSGAVRAEKYARQALGLAQGKPATAENKLQLYSGLAHSALGYALLKQEKTAPAIVELKTAITDLKGTGDAYSGALYRLSFAYAKTGKLPDAKVTLTELVGIEGPYQPLARDLLAKVNDGIARAGRRKK